MARRSGVTRSARYGPGFRTVAVMHLAAGGGPPQHIRPWLAALAERGSLEVVAPGPGFTFELYRDLATTRILPYTALTLPSNIAEAAHLPWALLAETKRFRELFRATKPHVVVVVTSAIPAVLAAAQGEGIPTIAYVAEVYTSATLRRRLGSILVRLTARWAAAIVASSETVANQFPRAARSRVRTIYPGIQADAYLRSHGAAFRRRHGILDASPCLAVIGNITHGRGQDVAVRALSLLRRRFPSVRCVFAGLALDRGRDRRYERDLHQLVRQLDLDDHVTFAGFVRTVADVYAAADVVVNPARVSEGFGRVAIEALAAGRPVVTTRTGATPEVLEHGTHALLVEPDDAEAIADAVTRLWTDDALREQLVQAGQEHVLASFDERASVEAFLEVVDDVLRQAAA
jgi:glycosyltransferase involved in cell wall biosynthesis